jgi:hypothetical protein
MTGFFAIARREVREHRVVLVAAAVASLGTLAVPLLHVGTSAAEVRGVTAFLGAIVFAAGIAIGLGATTLAPGMATRRIGFDFARPLSASAIWGGRLAGAMLLGAGAALILWVPAAIAGARFPWNDLWTAPEPPAAWPLLALVGFAVLFALAHCAALALRSRSGLLALDAVLAVLCAFLVWAAFSRLPIYRAEAPSLRLGVGLALAAGAACLAAGYASVVRGRTDARTGHRALSGVLWTVIGAAVLGGNGYAAWVHGAKPSDLREGFWVTPAAAGPWVTVSGPARGAEATFVYDAAAGRSERTFTPDWRGPVLSRDGKRAAWIEAGHHGPYPLWTWRLDVPGEKAVRTRIFLESYPYLFVLSEDGARLAIWEAGTLTVYDLAQQRALASARVASGDRQSLRGTFFSPDVFRIYRADDRSIDLLQLDVRARSLATLGRIETDGLRSFFVADTQGDRVLTLGSRKLDVRLFAATGAPIATLADTPAESRWPAFLPDGRIVLSERSSGNRQLRVFGADGREGAAVALPAASSVSLGGEVAPGVLCLGVTDAALRPSAWLADLSAGTIRKVADDLFPVASVRAIVGLGSEATKLFYGSRYHSLVRFDPLTGDRKVLLGKRP